MKALTHETWVRALHTLAESDDNPDVRDLASFAANVLESCESTPELSSYLDRRASIFLEEQP